MKRLLLAAAATATLAVVFAAPGGVLAQAGKDPAKHVQLVKLSFDDKGYVVTPSSVTRGVPVKMEVDLDTVKGCMRTVVIDAFNVKQTVKAGATTIEFTPTKSGPIHIVCGMNMGKGQFTVAEPAAK
ncbi:MAG TPA: cupredoxin domain-containing protein [Vicinamibacterales bacterium]|jgi:plastocyanin domain-containing protein|nr:cupredoxin domain-containing protein [Vicinamibacterales bacterium]